MIQGAAGPISDETPDAAPRSVSDVVTRVGVPPAELTPKVLSALVALIEEVERLSKAVDDRDARIVDLQRLADEDPLGAVLNRRAFLRELSRMVAFTQRYGRPSSVLYLDVNGMKRINDRFGHAAGDAVLTHVTRILGANLRGTDYIGRLGGDEFGVILTQADQDAARRKGEVLADAIAGVVEFPDGARIEVSVAWGVHTFTGQEPPDRVLASADAEMYRHKKGRSG